jgi:hypothetical protein
MTQSGEAVRLATTIIIISLSTAGVDELAPFFLIEPFGPAVLLARPEVSWLVGVKTTDELDADAFTEPVILGYESFTAARMPAAVTVPVVPCAF